jgi:hypothetical protein
LPHNEQVALQSIVDSDPDTDSKKYVANLVAPAYNMSRIPDSFADATALVHSVKIIRAPVYFSGLGTQAGAFSAVINPGLGALGDPEQFKIALVNPIANGIGQPWPSDLTVAGNFHSVLEGSDIRLDTHYQLLTQQQLATSTMSGDPVTSTAAVIFGNTVAAQAGYGLDIPYYTVPPAGGGPASSFLPPPGYYHVSIGIADATGGDINLAVTGFYGAVVTNEFVHTSTDDTAAVWMGYVLIPDDSVPAGSNIPPYITVTCTAAVAPIVAAWIMFTTTFDDVVGITANNGLVQKLRPTGCSVLATYTGPLLTNGGNIAAAFVPGGAVNSQYFITNSVTALGSIATWNNLASLAGAYNGPIKDGAYVWWSPTSLGDYNMYTPNEMASYKYPSIVIAGQWVPGLSDTSMFEGMSPVRIEVHTNYEICTDSVLLELKHQIGSQAIMDRCLNHLVGQQHAMMNAAHVAFMQKVINAFKSAGAWVWKNRKALLGVGAAAASIL